MGNVVFDLEHKIDEAKAALARVDTWIHQCDTKISITLAFVGVLLSSLFYYYKAEFLLSVVRITLNSHPSWLSLYLLVFFISFVFLCYGVFCLIKSLLAKIDTMSYSKDKAFLKSKIYFGSIAQYNSFIEFANDFDKETRSSYLLDIQSQLYINSIIAFEKYRSYNSGV